MAREIAVFIGEKEQTTSFDGKGKVKVFRKVEGCWVESREKEFNLESGQGLAGLRKTMKEVLNFLGQCRTMVALTIGGVPYYELEKAGCSVWEFEGRHMDFLDFILQKEEEAQEIEGRQKESIQLGPVETGRRCYRISLKEIQENNAMLTSKQVLQPFIRKGEFCELEVFCSHIPPWLEFEVACGGLEFHVENLGLNEVKIILIKNNR